MAAELLLEGPREQRRWTIAIRWILALPHLLLSLILGIGAFVAIIAMWVVALVTAHVPMGLAEFVARYLQYQTRVLAYGLYLLSDQFPSSDLRDDQYAVELELEEPTRLNRLSVLFRVILMIPSTIVSQLVTGGAFVLAPFMWLVALITGKLPDSAYFAHAAVLRYQARTWAFASMLTPDQPGGLFGDKTGMNIVAVAEDGPWTQPDATAPVHLPRIRALLLGRASKNLLILMIVLGVASNAAGQLASFGGDTDELEASYERLAGSTEQFGTDVQRCVTAGDPTCISIAHATLATAYGRFRGELATIDLPESALDEAAIVDQSAAEMQRILTELSQVQDAATYQQIALSMETAGLAFDQAVERLYDAVVFS